MMRLFNEKVDRKINIEVWSSAKKYTKELLILYYIIVSITGMK